MEISATYEEQRLEFSLAGELEHHGAKGLLQSLEREIERTLPLSLVLDLIRNSAPFRKQTSLNGFYQDNGEDADLLRLQLPLDSQLYPQISGHKSRFAIRFMPLDSENGQVPERLDFELACC